jgi:hypothetical protein
MWGWDCRLAAGLHTYGKRIVSGAYCGLYMRIVIGKEIWNDVDSMAKRHTYGR